jgi:serine kinase of HPr protein (carbohydrate metabolism regulator)
METVHATTVAIGGEGVLIRGPSGSGKSDFALRLIDAGAVLVADDRTRLTLEHDRVVARSPETIKGKIEVRGLGIARIKALNAAPICIVVDLVASEAVSRMPAPITTDLLGQPVRHILLAPFEASAPAKIRLAIGLGPEDLEG